MTPNQYNLVYSMLIHLLGTSISEVPTHMLLPLIGEKLRELTFKLDHKTDKSERDVPGLFSFDFKLETDKTTRTHEADFIEHVEERIGTMLMKPKIGIFHQRNMQITALAHEDDTEFVLAFQLCHYYNVLTILCVQQDDPRSWEVIHDYTHPKNRR